MSFQDELMQDFQKMLEYRESAGYATATYISSVTPFIKFCGDNYPMESSITQQMIDEWLVYYPYRKSQTQAAFISLIRQYTRFINVLGKTAFVPGSEYTIRRERYLPYIFSDEELACFFETVDMIATRNKKFQREIVLPVLFRMMYCCGMRPSEPLHLLYEDVNLKTGDIYIRKTKKNKDRHIIMSHDMLCLCQRYSELVAVEKYFFHRTDGLPFDTSWMTKHFHICWERGGLSKEQNPRPYDLRHAFASRNLIRWIDEGLDVMSLLPYLSTYMGHSVFRDTLYYVHILPERLRSTAGIDWRQFDTIFEESD